MVMFIETVTAQEVTIQTTTQVITQVTTQVTTQDLAQTPETRIPPTNPLTCPIIQCPTKLMDLSTCYRLWVDLQTLTTFLVLKKNFVAAVKNKKE